MNIINITILFLFSLSPALKADEHESPIIQNQIISEPVKEPAIDHSGHTTNHRPEPIAGPEGFIEKIHAFRQADDALEAQKIFMDIMQNLPDDRKHRFIERNYSRIADILVELRQKDPSGAYAEMVGALEKNGIGISREPSQGQPGGTRGRMMPRPSENNPVNKLVEIKTDAASGNTQDAQKKMENLSVEYSSSSAVQTAVAEFFSEVKNFKKAEDFSSKAITLDSENTDAYKLRAVSRYSMNDIKGAMEDIKKASEIEPQDETNRLLTALIESKKKISSRDITSLKALKDAMGDSREESKVYLSGNTSSAEKKDIPAAPEGVDYAKSKLYLKTAAAKNQMQDYEGALKYADLAIEKNPENLEAYIERANSNNYLGNYDEAIKDLSRVIQLQPSNAVALNMRAWALYKKGKLEDADADATNALKIRPDYADAMLSRSLSYEKQGKYAEMLSDLQNASAINPAYRARFQDAVAQYGARVPNFVANYQNKAIKIRQENPSDNKEEPTNFKRFLTILLFTVSGGLLIGLGLLHIFSNQQPESKSKITHPDILSPSVFYEGVATGKYKILSKIGQGGMGIVYKAVDQTLNREVAVKKMNDEIKMNEREKQRFIEEARMVAMLHHPNIIEIYTIFEEGEDIYLVFEYIDGETLDKKLAREVRMPFYEVKELVTEISKALSYAHKKNIIHRDMKLSNVMISRDGFVKVMDFGLAKIAREALSRVSTTEVVGSPAYMAPEQDRGIFLKESDIYSLGVCIYEMLTGELPFSGPDYHYQKENRLYAPISSSVPGLEKDFDEIINKLLSPDPQTRYKSIEEFLSDFNKIQ
ncbi:MAG: hypothetical protein Fur0012_00830 [Elusimicrobiota bacterium]